MSQCRDGVGSVLASEGIDDRLVVQEIGLPAIDEYLSFHRRSGIKLVPLLDLSELWLPAWSDGLGSTQAASHVGVSSCADHTTTAGLDVPQDSTPSLRFLHQNQLE
ncbi:hypothetical protein BFJ63_vAg14142 [Fusarium oxysporum f. sp. narcissi]|uniref:Uncharacterized protein n=1 Tax=Fusarium oxysporum f. sp. narcissi TaxID=451672 RepID=A0A4Q2VFK3_FUSOX|nr:hypothetical protein BFJ63_vAg14142 [Fusarium oxysporum f. sp. narcissi]